MHSWLLYLALGGGVLGSTPAGADGGTVQGRELQLMIGLQDQAADASAEDRQQRLDRLAADAGLAAGIRLHWLRPLAVGGEVVRVEGLAEGGAEALLQQLSAQPGVGFVEVDGPMQIGPGPRLPQTGRQRE